MAVYRQAAGYLDRGLPITKLRTYVSEYNSFRRNTPNGNLDRPSSIVSPSVWLLIRVQECDATLVNNNNNTPSLTRNATQPR